MLKNAKTNIYAFLIKFNMHINAGKHCVNISITGFEVETNARQEKFHKSTYPQNNAELPTCICAYTSNCLSLKG